MKDGYIGKRRASPGFRRCVWLGLAGVLESVAPRVIEAASGELSAELCWDYPIRYCSGINATQVNHKLSIYLPQYPGQCTSL